MRAIDEFATAEMLDSGIARQLRQAVVKEALFAFDMLVQLHRGESEARQNVVYWLWMVPDY